MNRAASSSLRVPPSQRGPAGPLPSFPPPLPPFMYRPGGAPQQPASKESTFWKLFLVLLVAGVLAGVLWWRWRRGKEAPQEAQQASAQQPQTQEPAPRHTIPEVISVQPKAALRSLLQDAASPDIPWNWCLVSSYGTKDDSMWSAVGYLDHPREPDLWLLHECDAQAFDPGNPAAYHYLIQTPSSSRVEELVKGASMPLMTGDTVSWRGSRWTVNRFL